MNDPLKVIADLQHSQWLESMESKKMFKELEEERVKILTDLAAMSQQYTESQLKGKLAEADCIRKVITKYGK